MFSQSVCFLVLVVCITSARALTWTTCGNETDPVKVTSLSGYIPSDNSTLLVVTGTGKVAFNLTTPIQAEVILSKKMFWGWTELPCIDNIGSCTYSDICKMTPYNSTDCPSEYIENKIPCACPILQGKYMVKNFPISLAILPHWMEEGSYRLKVTLKKDEERLICLLISQTL